MKDLILADINTNEELKRVELSKVLNVSVMIGHKLNKLSTVYGFKADDFTNYQVIQFATDTNNTGLIMHDAKECFIYFE